MLSDAPVAATIAVDDFKRARAFYTHDLGLPVASEPARGVLMLKAGGGSMLQLYERPDHTPSSATVASFSVADMKATVEGLAARGVHFEDCDMPGLKTGPDTSPSWVRPGWPG